MESTHDWHDLIERQMVQHQLAEIHADIMAYQEELTLLMAEVRWRTAAKADEGPSLAPAVAGCARRLTNLRRELYEVRVTSGR